jgi:protein-tyrosine phosphatase
MVMCKQGLNRSALMAGLILRELGASPAEVVEAIRAARPGALTNQTFVRLLLGDDE